MARFMRARGFSDYHELWRWSVDDLEGFWGALWDWFEIDGSYDRVLGSREMPGAEWFPGASLSYAEQLFRAAMPGEVAIVHASESQPLAELTWDELAYQVARCAAGLRRLGLGRGDRVAAYMPNVPETVVAFLACASIGAVWSSCAPEFGTPTVVDRFKQIEPKVLIATEGYRYGGKDFDRHERVAEIVADDELSIGDFVLAGGELAALVVIEATTRLVPGVLGNEASPATESYAHGLLEYPQYTRPGTFRGHSVPDVLLSGDHAAVERWRTEQAERVTRERRPDLLR
jgi:tRNA (guanine-N1)-methyltransferase